MPNAASRLKSGRTDRRDRMVSAVTSGLCESFRTSTPPKYVRRVTIRSVECVKFEVGKAKGVVDNVAESFSKKR